MNPMLTIQPKSNNAGGQIRSSSKEALMTISKDIQLNSSNIGTSGPATLQASATTTQPRLHQKLEKVVKDSNHRRGGPGTNNQSIDNSSSTINTSNSRSFVQGPMSNIVVNARRAGKRNS